MKQKIKANRQSIRAPVAPSHVQGLLTRTSNGEQAPFLIWDVSDNGLGLWCVSELAVGEDVRLTVGAPFPLVLECRVMWVDQSDLQEGYRCGMEITNGHNRLAVLYEHFRKKWEKQSIAD